MTRRTSAAPRAGFTLIELLVVIGIVVILAALLVGGVMRAFVTAKKTQASSDVTNLTQACGRFKAEFGFYPPSTFTIPTTSTATTDVSLIQLKRMFPRWDTTVAPDAFALLGSDGSTTTKNPGDALDASQALTYFLGGPTGTGWHPTKPAAPAGSTKKGPFFDAPNNRVEQNRFLDPWKNPFAYFASNASGYSGTATVNGTTVNPFKDANGKWVNQDGVQIVSAGPDGKLGTGGTWTPGSGDYVDNGPGYDDIGNFNGGAQLGVVNK